MGQILSVFDIEAILGSMSDFLAREKGQANLNVVSGQVVTAILALEHVGGMLRTNFSEGTQRFIGLMEQLHRHKLEQQQQRI